MLALLLRFSRYRHRTHWKKSFLTTQCRLTPPV